MSLLGARGLKEETLIQLVRCTLSNPLSSSIYCSRGFRTSVFEAIHGTLPEESISPDAGRILCIYWGCNWR